MTPNSTGRFDNLHNGGNMPRQGGHWKAIIAAILIVFIGGAVLTTYETEKGVCYE